MNDICYVHLSWSTVPTERRSLTVGQITQRLNTFFDLNSQYLSRILIFLSQNNNATTTGKYSLKILLA